MLIFSRKKTLHNFCHFYFVKIEHKRFDDVFLNQNIINLNFSFLISESNERLQVHLKERMHSLEEKNHLSNELERTKKKLEEAGTNKARLEAELAEMKLNLRLIFTYFFSHFIFRRICKKSCRKRG